MFPCSKTRSLICERGSKCCCERTLFRSLGLYYLSGGFGRGWPRIEALAGLDYYIEQVSGGGILFSSHRHAFRSSSEHQIYCFVLPLPTSKVCIRLQYRVSSIKYIAVAPWGAAVWNFFFVSFSAKQEIQPYATTPDTTPILRTL